MGGCRRSIGESGDAAEDARLTCCRGVGFLQYWTASNIPLFFLATPMLAIMLASGIWAWDPVDAVQNPEKDDRKSQKNPQKDRWFTGALVRYLAVPQLMLAILALTTYHVQIVTRLSSGYPIWYWWLASLIMRDKKVVLFDREWNMAEGVIRWMVIYGLIQAGLFASFLPPA